MMKKIRVLLHSCQLQGSHRAVAGGHRVGKEDCGGEVGRNEEMGSSARRRDEEGAGEWQVTPRIPHEVIGGTVTEWNRVTEGEVGWEKLTWGFGLQASRDVRRSRDEVIQRKHSGQAEEGPGCSLSTITITRELGRGDQKRGRVTQEVKEAGVSSAKYCRGRGPSRWHQRQ